MHPAGRHRAPGRLQSISTALGVSARPVAKASAVVVVTGGIVAALSTSAAASASHRGGDLNAAAVLHTAGVARNGGGVAFAPVAYPITPASTAASTPTSRRGDAIQAQLATMRAAQDRATSLSVLAVKAPAKGVHLQDFGRVGFTGLAPVIVQPNTGSGHRQGGGTKSPTRQPGPTPPPSNPSPPPSNPSPPPSNPSPPPSNPSPPPSNPSPPPPDPSPPSHGPTSGVLAIAAKYVGVPYVYGGSSPSGFDCSGFTSYVFAQVGIHLPRTAAGQQAAVAHVSSPQPGDLVFYGYPAYHVGIYAGSGMMYDAPKPGGYVSKRAIWGARSFGRP